MPNDGGPEGENLQNLQKARIILLNVISPAENEKIHEGVTQVKETKAPVIIQKFNAFRMEEEEDSEEEHADFAHMARPEDDLEVDLISDAESDTDQEDERYLGTKLL